MPSRNILKISVPDCFYHIYNRGVEKRIIFEDEQDYKVMIGYLREYLSPRVDIKDINQTFTLKGSTFQGIPHLPKNYFGKIELHSYCLMPNHFHLLIKQIEDGAMQSFMRSLSTRYSMYFNKKYSRVGPLFQGIYKAAIIDTDNYLLHLSRYIHLNSLDISPDLVNAYSSYGEYIGMRKTVWVKTSQILSYFVQSKNDFSPKAINNYKDFVEKYAADSGLQLGGLVLE